VVVLDNLSTGRLSNLDHVRFQLPAAAWERCRVIEGDITRLADCHAACTGVDIVLHQAALVSVPRYLAAPLATHAANVNGFVNVLVAARDAGIKRIVYASSSSVYGDHPALPKVEPNIGQPLSLYAATKRIDEIYAGVADRLGFGISGLRPACSRGRRPRGLGIGNCSRGRSPSGDCRS